MAYTHSSDSEGKLFFYLCAGAVCGIVAFFKGFQLRQKKKLIENIPTSTVRGIAVGLVEIKGAAREFQQPLRSPFSDSACVFYRYKVQELRSSGKNRHWATIAEYASPDCFYLEDETGKILVDPKGAEFHLHTDRTYSSHNKAEFYPKLEALGIATGGFLGFDKELRCFETYIAPGDELYVMGPAKPNAGAGSFAVGYENLYIAKEPGTFFFIAAESERDVVADFGWKMYLGFYGGPVLTVSCLFILIGHFFKNMF